MTIPQMFSRTRSRLNLSYDGMRSRSPYWWSQLFLFWDQTTPTGSTTASTSAEDEELARDWAQIRQCAGL